MEKILDKSDCSAILKNDLKKNVKIIDYHLKKFSDEVLGFMGDHFTLTVTYEEDVDKLKTIDYFVKTTPILNTNHNEYVEGMQIFHKESLLYNGLLKKLSDYTSHQFVAKCYLTKEDKCLVMENLKSKGFELKRGNRLDIRHCKSLIKTLGKFHAASIIYEESEKLSIRERFKDEIKETTFSWKPGHPRQKWCCTVAKCISDCIKLIPGFEYSNGIIKSLNRIIFEELPHLLAPSDSYRNVLTHDDLHDRNFMFDEDLNCILIDFQLTRFTPPALDFLQTLYLNLEPHILKANYDELINIYYTSLATELEKFNMDSNKLLSLEEFVRSLSFYKLPALIECVMYATIIYMPEDVMKNVLSNLDAFNEFNFTDRSKYVVKEFVENSDFSERFSNILLPLLRELEKQ